MNPKWTAILSASALVLSLTTVAAAGTRNNHHRSTVATTPDTHQPTDVTPQVTFTELAHQPAQGLQPMMLTAAALMLPQLPLASRSATLQSMQLQMRSNARKRKLKLQADALRKAQELAKKKAAARKAALHKSSKKSSHTSSSSQTSRSASFSSVVGGSGNIRAAQVAMRYVGVPYHWGGSTPSGFDCSGLVRYAFAQVGVSLPHSSFAQFTMGQPVSNLTPGDLVFFNTDGPGASHVGIYLGGGRFVNAAGSHVQVDSMSGYWAQHYIGARRVR